MTFSLAWLFHHEQMVRARERAREWRRIQPLMPVGEVRWSDDFEGAVE